jgi:hypothetical protein
MCFDFLYVFGRKYFFILRTERDSIINVRRCSCNLVVIPVILMKLEFSRQSFEKSPKSNFKNMRHVGAEMLHGDRRDTDGQVDMKNLIVPFRSFANTRKKCVVFKTRHCFSGIY